MNIVAIPYRSIRSELSPATYSYIPSFSFHTSCCGLLPRPGSIARQLIPFIIIKHTKAASIAIYIIPFIICFPTRLPSPGIRMLNFVNIFPFLNDSVNLTAIMRHSFQHLIPINYFAIDVLICL